MPDLQEASELLKANKVDEAVESLIQAVKQSPADAGVRMQLAELLCLAGDWQRADQQLETATTQAPQAAVRASQIRQTIRAATARDECLKQGRPPELLGEADDLIGAQLKLVMALREGDWSAAAGHAADAEALAARRPVSQAGADAVDARDQDDAWSAVLEVLTSTGKYYWVPMSRLESLSVYPPATPTELIWAMADISVHEGPEGRVFLPAIYPTYGDEEQDAAVKLGRSTDWQEKTDGLTLGSGLRMWWLGEEEKTVFELNDLEFAEG